MRTNSSDRQSIIYEQRASETRPAAEVAHRMWEEHLDRQSGLFLDCYGGVHLNGDTLLCECSLCAPTPEPGCRCELCALIRSGACGRWREGAALVPAQREEK